MVLAASAITATGLFSFRPTVDGNVIGKVVPPEGVEKVWAINGSDSLEAQLIDGGFSFSVKPGTWKIVVDAKEPFKDAVLENVEAKDGENTDLGEITLQQ